MKKFQIWKPFGSDAAYLYKCVIRDPDLSLSYFLDQHTDWALKYKRSNLGEILRKTKQRLQLYLEDKCKLSIFFMLSFLIIKNTLIKML